MKGHRLFDVLSLGDVEQNGYGSGNLSVLVVVGRYMYIEPFRSLAVLCKGELLSVGALSVQGFPDLNGQAAETGSLQIRNDAHAGRIGAFCAKKGGKAIVHTNDACAPVEHADV